MESCLPQQGLLRESCNYIDQHEGCDVSLVSRHRNGVTRLTARATRKSTIAGVHLGVIMESLAEKLGGNGGGHDGAAGFF